MPSDSTSYSPQALETAVVPAPQKMTPVTFPTDDDNLRLRQYGYFEKLFLGEHFAAFNIKVESVEFTKQYSMIRYVMVNFAGMISKIVSDLLFGEAPRIKAGDGGDQEFIEALAQDNNIQVLLYESSLSNSALGDDNFKVRVGKRNPSDEKSTIIMESFTPKIYFPHLDPFNVKGEPAVVDIAWEFKQGNEKYVRKEIHEAGYVRNEVWKYDGRSITAPASLSVLGIPDLLPQQETGIDQKLTVHVPNYRFGNRHFGLSDYLDVESLFYAINNRMSMIDNILDKHSDPILMVPPGVLDENGKVKKKALGVIEVQEGESGKPEYVVWDASLENAFKEIEKLVDFLYMTGEVSPDVLGLGQGVNESGRALKLKLIRTLAKVNRKKLYYTQGIKQMFMIAQKLAKKHGIEVKGKTLKGEPTEVSIDWNDGLPIDDKEQIETEQAALDAGLTNKLDAVQRVYQVDEEKAQEILDQRKAENDLAIPKMTLGGANPFDKTATTDPTKTVPPMIPEK